MGRPRATSPAALERRAFELFARQGFDETTVDDIAAAAGIARRTFFRYFASKNDLVWGDFEGQLRRLRDAARRDRPAHADDGRGAPGRGGVQPLRPAGGAVAPPAHGAHPAGADPPGGRHPAVRVLAADHHRVHGRADRSAPTARVPRLAGHLVLAAAVSAYEHWLASDERTSLADLLDEAIRHLGAGLAAVLDGAEPAP